MRRFPPSDTKGEALDKVQKKVNLKKSAQAPVKKGEKGDGRLLSQREKDRQREPLFDEKLRRPSIWIM